MPISMLSHTYTYMHTHMYTCLCTCLCPYTCYLHTYTCVLVYISAFVHLHMHTYMCCVHICIPHTHLPTHRCIYEHMSVCKHVCMYCCPKKLFSPRRSHPGLALDRVDGAPGPLGAASWSCICLPILPCVSSLSPYCCALVFPHTPPRSPHPLSDY
jgi:hypothetical protein